MSSNSFTATWHSHRRVALNYRERWWTTRITLKALANSSPGLVQPWDSGSLESGATLTELRYEKLPRVSKRTLG